MEHFFCIDYYYVFVHTYYTIALPRRVETMLLVLKPLYLSKDHICFPFSHYENGWQDKLFIAKEKILAMGDMTNGTIGIMGRKGRYTLLNKELFYKYCLVDIIQTKS